MKEEVTLNHLSIIDYSSDERFQLRQEVYLLEVDERLYRIQYMRSIYLTLITNMTK